MRSSTAGWRVHRPTSPPLTSSLNTGGPAPLTRVRARADGLRTRRASRSEQQPGVAHALRLAGSELRVAGVERVVHVVVHRIEPRGRARVLAVRASGCRCLLCRGVVDEVALGVAAAEEGVLEVEPVTDRVRARLALVEPARVGR